MGRPRSFDYEQAKQLRAEGLSYVEIGPRLGVSANSAAKACDPVYRLGCRCLACRQAASVAKKRRREQSRVPCSHGCGRMVDSINRRDPDKPPECRPCFYQRRAAERKQKAAA